MAFSDREKIDFIAALKRMGWIEKVKTIESPTGGLYFNDSHFRGWSPRQMAKIFAKRAERIEFAKIGNWEQKVVENRNVVEALNPEES